MGNSFCNYLIKDLDKNGLDCKQEKKKILNKNSDSGLFSEREEMLIKGSKKNNPTNGEIISNPIICLMEDSIDIRKNLEEKIKNFAFIIKDDEFEAVYLKILKNVNLNPLSESNLICNELNNEDEKTYNNSESQSNNLYNNNNLCKNNDLKIMHGNNSNFAIQFINDEEKKYFKGEFNSNLQKNGFGILINKDNSLYEGNWENDKACGFGRFIDKTGNFYEGNFENIL